MKAEITMSQLWWNPRLMGFFFRQQAINTLEELMEQTINRAEALDLIDDYFSDIDDCEEAFYNESVEDIIEMIGIPVLEGEFNEG